MLWTLPATLPSLADLRVSVDMLDQQCGAKATRQHVAWCVSKLAMAFESGKKLSDEDAKFRASIWLESCGDLGDALWSEATMAAIQSSKWMPKPAEFRAFVGTKLEARAKRLKRCREMLEAKAKQEPGAVPVRTMVPKIDQLRKLLRQQLDDTGIPEDHRLFNSANTERSLAWFEKRPIEPWARDVLAPMPSAQPQRSEHTHHVGEKARAVMSTMQKSVEPWRYGEPVYQRAQPPGGEEPPPHDHIPEAMEMDP